MKKGFIFLLLMFIMTISSCSCKQKDNAQNDVVNMISTKDLLITDVNAQIIDVRTPEEYQEGYIKSAININVNGEDFIAKASKLDKSKPVYVYCKLGGRSAKAADKLAEEGFTKVYDLKGGITQWTEDKQTLTQNQ